MKKIIILTILFCLNLQHCLAFNPNFESKHKVHYTLTCLSIPFKKKALPTKLLIDIQKNQDSNEGFTIKNLESETFFTSQKKIFRDLIDYDKYPTFGFKSNLEKPVPIKLGEGFSVPGKSTFHGVTKDVTLNLIAELTNENELLIKGVYIVKMSGYGLKPPKLALILIDDNIPLAIEFYAPIKD